MSRFTCSTCSYACSSLKRYILHCKLHSVIPNQRFQCGIPGCSEQFSTYSGFRSHLTRVHANSRKCMLFESSSISVICPLEFCRQKTDDLAKYVIHLKSHLKSGVSVSCPFKKCGKSFNVLSSFKSHMSRAHRGWNVECVDPVYYANNKKCRYNVVDTQNSESVLLDDSCAAKDMECSADDDTVANRSEAMESLLNKFALWLMNMEAKLHVPSSTIQAILEEVRDINNLNTNYVIDSMLRTISANNIDDNTTDNLLACLKSNPLCMLLWEDGALRTEHSRKTLYKEKFNYVAPVAMSLESSNGKRRVYHYIPVLQSVKALFQDSSIKCALKSNLHKPENDQFVDLSDGLVMKQSEFFKANVDGLQIILYQDAFEVVNPLGSARGKHKLLAVYYMLGNMLPAVRSGVDQMQLVLLCKEKDYREFGAGVIFRPLLEDLKVLETAGVDLGSDFGVKRGTLACILGDNLGSHGIGGFVESFSGSGHFCRFCLVTNNDMLHGQYLARCFPCRTKELYDAAVGRLHDNKLNVAEGIKSQSVFNSLSFYHVCSPGLPPCLGHDLFEGIVPYDLHLYLAYFVNAKKWFTYAFLNHKIQTFAFRGTEANDRPAVVNVQSGKIIGHAVQVWSLIRFLPLLIGLKISDASDPVWRLVIDLRRLVELVCAPVVSYELIAEMDCVIEEYLQKRVELFPAEKLKPKHHFMSHYAMLTVQFGPLMRLWTLRFESKHSYFKACIRAAQNFKNITYTLSHKHQLLQAFYSAGSLFRQPVAADNGIPFHMDLYAADIRNALELYPQLKDSNATRACESARINGLQYKRSSFVITDYDDEGNVQCGEIIMLLAYNGDDDIFILCNVRSTVHANDVGLLQVSDHCKGITCIRLSQLLDIYPLEAYAVGSGRYIAGHHAFSVCH
jgi:hypothetical protein